MEETTIVYCDRCKTPCKLAATATEDAQLLKHATMPETSGYCSNCAVADFFKNRSPLGMSMMSNPAGKAMLLDPRVQKQFAGLLAAGNADANPSMTTGICLSI